MCRRRVLRPLACLVSLSLILSTSGCVTPPPSLDLHNQLLGQRIALRPDPGEYPISLDVFAKSKPQGALKGAGRGIAEILSHADPGSCSGEICGAVLLLYLGFAVVVGGSVGAIQGLRNATSKQRAADIETYVEDRLAGFSSHLDLAKRVLAKARAAAGIDLELVPAPQDEGAEPNVAELGALEGEGFGKLLELRIVRLAFVGDQGDNPHLQLTIEAQLTLLDIASGQQVYRRTFRYLGTSRRYSDWIEEGPSKLGENLSAGLDQLAEDIVNTLFIAYLLPVSSGTWTIPWTTDYGCCWLCPRTPSLEIDYFPAPRQTWPVVSSLRPHLAWKPFPDANQQVQLQEQTGSSATRVRYDLRIWEDLGQGTREPVYQRYGLPAATHRLEEDLRPQTDYLWSMRACFDLGQGSACTPWAFSMVPALAPDVCETVSVPPRNYYRFRTP